MVQLHTEQTAGKLLQHHSGHFNVIFLTHPILSGFSNRRVALPAGSHVLVRLRSTCHRHICGLQTFWTFGHFELHFRALFETAIAIGLNGGEVYKDIFSILPLDESVALGRVKPFHCAFFFHVLPFQLYCSPSPYLTRHKRKGGRGYTRATPIPATG